MRTSELFNGVMAVLWGNDPASHPKEAVAIASYIKTHRVNAENACEVLKIMWPEATFLVRELSSDQKPDEVLFDVQFEDESQVLLICNHGIGDSMEVVS